MSQFFLALILLVNNSFGENLFQAAKKDAISPFTTEAKHYFHLGLATTGFFYIFFKDDIILGLQKETNEHKPLGDYALYGDYGGQLVPNALYAGGMYAAYLWTDDKDYQRFASQMFRASLYSGLFTNVIKELIPETRPNKVGRNSFPSGHTTTAFAFASIIGMNHKWYWSVPAYTFATFVGFSRINDNKHFLHDVTMGATVGIMYGLGIYYLDQENQEQRVSGQSTTYYIAPMLVPGGLGMYFTSVF
ncbi:MAG: phosphatase PAP2 family protein [Bdellovibrionales bacterium]|nr:phosphatase PAP2 family protein [Bdellovibrionales bacterium]